MKRDLLLVAASMFTWGAGEGLFLYFQPLYLQQWGASPVMIGTIYGAIGVAMAIAQIPAGYLSDRIGSRNIMWASWISGTVAAWIMALANSLPVFIVGLIFYNLTAFVMAPLSSFITGVRGKWSVQRSLTLVYGMYSLGAVVGPIIGGILSEQFGLRMVYHISAIIFIISTALVLFIHQQAPREVTIKTENEHLWQNKRFLTLLALILFTMFALYLPQPLTPNFLQNQRGLDATTIGILGACGNLGNALLVLGLGNMVPASGFLLGQLLIGLFAFALWKGDSTVMLGVGYFFVGGYRLCRSMMLAAARHLVQEREQGLAFGIIETVNSLTVILAPILAGFLYEKDPGSIYEVCLVLVGLALVLSLLFFPRMKPDHTDNLPVTPLERG
jgi:MFS family permease